MPDSTPLKRCSKCGAEYPATTEYFPPRKRNHSGLHSHCRPCARVLDKHYDKQPQRMKQRNERRKERRKTDPVFVAKERARAMRTHNRIKADPVLLEHKRTRIRKRLKVKSRDPEFKARRAIADKKHRENHPEYYKRQNERRRFRWNNEPGYKEKQMLFWKPEFGKKWRDNNPEKIRSYASTRRARKKNAPGLYTPEDINVLWNSQHGKCWWCSGALNPDDYHIDHRIPLSRGGTNHPNNLCVSCPTCNLSKSDKMPWEWRGRLL